MLYLEPKSDGDSAYLVDNLNGRHKISMEKSGCHWVLVQRYFPDPRIGQAEQYNLSYGTKKEIKAYCTWLQNCCG